MTTTDYDDPISPNSAYLDRIRAVSWGGVSPNSEPLLANTVIYASFFVGGVVKAIDLAQLRTAVNAVRALAGLSLATFTDPAVPGTIIRAVHLTELRTALNNARVALSLAAASFTDPVLDGVVVKGIHHDELRLASGTPGLNTGAVAVWHAAKRTSIRSRDGVLQLLPRGLADRTEQPDRPCRLRPHG